MCTTRTIVPTEKWCWARIRLSSSKQPVYTTKDSLPCITYKLYSFKDLQEPRLEDIFYGVEMKPAKEMKVCDSLVSMEDRLEIAKELDTQVEKMEYSLAWKWPSQQVYILLGEIGGNRTQYGQLGITYQVVCMKTNKILSCLVDESYAFREGEQFTLAYFNSNRFFISNEGNAGSIVVVQIA